MNRSPRTSRSANRRRRAIAALCAVLPTVLAIVGCGSDEPTSDGATAPSPAGSVSCGAADGAKGPGVGTKAIGFVYAGPRADHGTNAAVHAGAEALRAACPDLDVLESDVVAATAQMTRAAERMIDAGARIIFATSPAYKDLAVALADKHGDVAVLQQGVAVDPLPPNLGTYATRTYETVYLTGVAAATVTKSKRLGFVAGPPTPQTLLNVNAFELGARSVDPRLQTHVAFTAGRCDPADQSDAARSLLAKRADVLAQDQDCTATVVKAAENEGSYAVGYQSDARSLAPKGWLTAAESNWSPLFGSIVSSIQRGTFAKSAFHGNLLLGLAPTKGIPSPLRLARYGLPIDVTTARRISDAKAKIILGRSPFTGPVVDQDGKVRISDGKTATDAQLSAMSYLVKGVVGSIPK
ncbi:MAG TPA: BMP family ABC transporter substrate-binding protein [Solirubrobacteraceae bacterium]|jgi:simple sugar transport system substrate-binding protein/basic membrane protein A|nr:BMP family ABC transporter substrate-binding protein [Solirubrobacteraceae bacterium]